MSKQTQVEIGTSFGSWTTTSSTYLNLLPSGHTRSFVQAVCTCGTHREVMVGNLVRGLSTSCGDCNPVALPEVGKSVGQWHVDSVEGNYAYCTCSCGTVKKVYRYTLGIDSKSCGHDRRNDGRRKAKLQRIWNLIKQRCYLQGAIGWKDYGARGITMCDEWLASFEAFYEWSVEHGYQALSGLQIDRIDNDGPYSPDNCRWVDRFTNARNKRNTRMVTAFGETKPLPSWIEDSRCDVSYSTLHARLTNGWDPELAIASPTGARRS